MGFSPRMTKRQFTTSCEFDKVDEGLGMVFGFAIVCTVDGCPYIDLQKDHIPDEAMIEAAVDFAKSARIAGDMHLKDQDGNKIEDGVVPFLFPLTEDIAKAMGITSKRTGLMVGLKPSEKTLTKFMDGTYTGFSIGGDYVENEEALIVA